MHSEYIFQISGAHMHSNRIGIWMDLSEFRQIIQGNQTHIHAILLEALLLGILYSGNWHMPLHEQPLGIKLGTPLWKPLFARFHYRDWS